MRPATDQKTTITASGITAGGRRHNTEQSYEGVRMLTTEETTHHTTATGTFDAASRLCTAWQWLETQRQTAPEGADVWDIRWQAQQSTTYLTDLLHTLQAGEYRLSPLQLHGQGEDRKAVWSAQDALVLKWVALSIEGQLPLHPACEHVKGHGGGRQSVNRLHALLTGTAPEHTPEHTTDTPKKTADYAWVCRTDIRGYYRNISKETLLNQVRQHVQDPVLTELIRQYIHYTVEDGGAFHTPEKGISRGCALSPLMGALHLVEMDEHFSRQKGIHYARYMDDIVILAKTRWSLRKHTKRLMQWFSEYGFEAHPDKTQIGRTAKGFDWMGAWLTHEGVTDIAPRAKANHREKVRRLYERLARVPHWLRHRRQQQVHARVSAYRKRWNIWALGVLSVMKIVSVHAVTTSGFPLNVPGGAGPGTILSSGTITGVDNAYSYLAYSSGTDRTYTYLSLYCSNGSCSPPPVGDVRVVGGRPALIVYQGCGSIGFAITGIDLSVIFKKGDPIFPYAGPVAGGMDMTVAVPPGLTASQENYSVSQASGTIYGDWVLLDDPQSSSYSCSPTGAFSQKRLFAITNNKSQDPQSGLIFADQRGPLLNLYSSATNLPSAPATAPYCEFLNTSAMINFPSTISPAQINNTANSKVIAKATSPISLSISCSGNMSGVQPVVELQWTKSAPLGGTGGLRIGVANDVADNSNGILLSTADSAVGAYGSCGTVPTGYDMCGAYYITPGTPLTLYPVVFRNTNTTDKARSGVHTVTGTLKVVVP